MVRKIWIMVFFFCWIVGGKVSAEKDIGIEGDTFRAISQSDPQALVFKGYKKEGNFELYNVKVVEVYVHPTMKSEKLYSFAPRHFRATERNGDWFYVKTPEGYGWLYWDKKKVKLREIEEIKAKIHITEKAYVHIRPFKVYKTKKKIRRGTYIITKKAGYWYYVDGKGWIYQVKATYPGTIKKLEKRELRIKSRNVPIKQSIVEVSEKVRPGAALLPRYITIHNTSSTEKGVNAKHYAKYLHNLTRSQHRWASWHYTVDDKEIYQHLPLNEHGWHAGDNYGPGNCSSIGIEIAENKDGNYNKAQENAAFLVATLLHRWKVPYNQIETWVVPHQKWSGKNCPAKILTQSNRFEGFLNQVRLAY